MGKLTPELRRVLKLQYPEDTIIEVRGEIVHFKDTEGNWEKLAQALGLEVFKEEYSDRNWVLYNPKNFKEVKGNLISYLVCISEENLELPINCSSCFNMFYEFEFKNKDSLKNFDTSNVKSMSYMFEGCSFPEKFSLGDKFDANNVKSMDEMFSYCKLPTGFSLGDNFDTCNVENMEYMFSNSTLPDSFSLGNKFDTSNVENMRDMFYRCTLPNQFSLGNKFNISNVKNMDSMFSGCEFPEGKIEKDFDYDNNKIVEWLKSRNLNKTSNTNFFN